MRNFPCTVIVCAFVLSLAACPGDDEPNVATPDAGDPGALELSVLAYNVAGLPQEFSGEQPGKNLPLISPHLNAYDVVLTQEDFDWWAEVLNTFDFVNYRERLRAQVDHAHQSEMHPGIEAVGLELQDRPAPLVGDGLGILSRHPFTDVVRVPWPGCFGGLDTSDRGAGDCLAMKGFMVATLQLPGDRQIDLYTLHVEAGGSERDQELQAANMLQLSDFINEHSKGRALILGGDTNLHTGGAHPDGSGAVDAEIWSMFLAATGLRDACDELSCEQPSAIDKIAFRDGSGVSLQALSHRFETNIFIDEAGQPLSDHNPLHVRFRLTP